MTRIFVVNLSLITEPMDIFALIRGLPKITQIGVLALDGRIRWRFGRFMYRFHERDRRRVPIAARFETITNSPDWKEFIERAKIYQFEELEYAGFAIAWPYFQYYKFIIFEPANSQIIEHFTFKNRDGNYHRQIIALYYCEGERTIKVRKTCIAACKTECVDLPDIPW